MRTKVTHRPTPSERVPRTTLSLSRETLADLDQLAALYHRETGLNLSRSVMVALAITAQKEALEHGALNLPKPH